MNEANNKIVKLKITGITSEGAGIARTEDGVVFVNRALPGEIVTAKIFERHKDFSLAKIVEIEKSNPERVKPECEHYYKCGGCQLQHASYNLQLKLKAAIVRDAMTRLGGFEPESFDANIFDGNCTASPKAWGYRNKAAFPVAALASHGITSRLPFRRGDDEVVERVKRNANKKLIAGFYRAGTHRIEPIKTCPVNAAPLNTIYQSLLTGLNDLGIDGYDETNNTGKLRHIIMRAGVNNLLSFVINGKLSAKNIKSLIALGNKTKSVGNPPCGPDTITLNHNSRPGNTILGNYTEALTGSGIISEKLGDFTLEFDTTSFFQVNTLQAGQLFKYASGLVSDAKNILELYSGVGSLTCYLAGNGANVTSIEEWRSAVKMAERNLKLNNLSGRVQALCGKCEDVINDLVDNPPRGHEVKNYDAVVLDPPRDGCNKAVLSAINDLGIKKIIYVSCNPATLARDCKILASGYEYKLKSVRAFDMFPQTAHVESVAVLEK